MMRKSIFPAIVGLVMMSTACSDWTEMENKDYYRPFIEEENPAEYAKYLENLRAFKATEHKVMILTMESTANYPVTQAQLPMAMPDSADYICIKNSSELHEVVVASIKDVRERKGTKVLASVDNAITDDAWVAYSNGKVDAGEPAPTVDERKAFYKENATAQLASYDKYGFDGVMVSYKGNNYTAENKASQEGFIEAVREWSDSHPEHLMLMRGSFKNVTDEELRARSKYFIIVLDGAGGTSNYTTLLDTWVSPLNEDEKDRNIFEIMVPEKAGEEQVGDSPLEAAKTILSDEVANYESYKTIGLCVSNADDDYFTSNESYANIRPAINLLNNGDTEGQDTEEDTANDK